jgi:hypothetical protein
MELGHTSEPLVANVDEETLRQRVDPTAASLDLRRPCSSKRLRTDPLKPDTTASSNLITFPG